MKSAIHFPDTTYSKSQNIGETLQNKILYFLQKLSLKRSSNLSLENVKETSIEAAPKNLYLTKELLMQTIDYCDQLIYFKDTNFKYIDFNEKFKNFFAIKKNIDYKNLNDIDIFGINIAYQLKKHERTVLLNKTPSVFDLKYHDKLFHVKIVPLKKEGKVVGIVGYLEDRSLYKNKIDNLLELNEFLKKRCDIFEKLSMIDPLTNVYNKKKFYNILEKEIERAKRYDEPLSLIIFDIDNFKKINDTYGHLIGDNILKKIVNGIKGSIRKIDMIARIGGDEFVIIAPNTDIVHAEKLAIKLKNELDKFEFKEIKNKVTCSFGIAQYKIGEDINSLFKRADEALYKSKEEGRNRISLIK